MVRCTHSRVLIQALQEVGLFFGNWWSQESIRSLQPNRTGRAVSVASLVSLLKALSLDSSSWPGSALGSETGYEFLAWMSANEALGAPTLAVAYEWLPPASQSATGDRLVLVPRMIAPLVRVTPCRHTISPSRAQACHRRYFFSQRKLPP